MPDFTGKRAIVTGASRATGGAIDLELRARRRRCLHLRAHADFNQGIAAFAEKRPPQWQGQ